VNSYNCASQTPALPARKAVLFSVDPGFWVGRALLSLMCAMVCVILMGAAPLVHTQDYSKIVEQVK
jgi:hypothetical protein